jgi:FkbM family methyltransferase
LLKIGSTNPNRFMTSKPKPTKLDALARLQSCVPITSIVDVGVRECTSELIKAFPEKHHYLFEPMATFHPTIKKHYASIPHTLFPIALSEESSTLYLIETSLEADGRVTHSRISNKPETCDGQRVVACNPLPVRRFDGLEVAAGISSDFLLKVDVDGKDLEVLKGFGQQLRRASVIVVECTVPTLMARIGYTAAEGFSLIDLVDIVYYGKALYQLDAILVRNDVVTTDLRPPIQNFERSLWSPVIFS